MLATGHDLGYYLYDTLPSNPDPETIYYTEDLDDPYISLAIANAGNSFLYLDSGNDDTRETANQHVQKTIAFIAATPYTFIEEGK